MLHVDADSDLGRRRRVYSIGDGSREDECLSCLTGFGLHVFIGQSYFELLLMVLHVDGSEIQTIHMHTNIFHMEERIMQDKVKGIICVWLLACSFGIKPIKKKMYKT